jgi:hypothetical protein
MKVSEIPAFVSSVKDELLKAKTEILDKIQDLENATQDAELSPEATAALNDLKSAAQALDDVVPDAPSVTDVTDTGLGGTTLRG